MSTDHHGGKGYAPLPQSISNTDTEDEEDCLTRPKEVHKEHTDNTTTTTTITETTTVHENGIYYPLDETRNSSNHTRNGQTTLKYYRDDIPIMVIEGHHQNDLWKRRDMSPLRRFCLVASISLCIITIVVFLYVLPCDNSMVCPPVVEPQSSISWDKTLQSEELHGPITVIPGNPYNLVFLLRGQRYRGNDTSLRDQRQIPPDGGGVMSMRGNSGLPLWLVPLKSLPTEIDCISIDTDRSGKPDCIVTGEDGLLVSIEPIAGTVHWNSKIHTFGKLPVILPDVDSDGTDDLLTVERSGKNKPSLILLSGQTGQLLGRFSPGNCSSIDIYNLVLSGAISYTCHNGSKNAVTRSMSFKGLLHAIKLPQVHKQLAAKETWPRMFETLKVTDAKNSWRPTPYHHLSIENEGACPGESCRTSVNLTLQKFGNQPVSIWSNVSLNSFASKPEFLIMPGNNPYISGFAIKFWHWIIQTAENTEKASAITERRLTERILIIFVNYTDVQVMNPSQTDVTQVCRDSNCQPDLDSRAQFSSIRIAYISNDGYPELISYWSSFNVESPNVLTSKVQVVKLDSIVPNLPRANI